MKDVVCGMEAGKNSKFSIEYKGIKFVFCSASCLKAFKASPEKFSGKR